MTLKTKMSLLLFLTSISIVSIGFSSWSITAESVAEAKGNIEVDNVLILNEAASIISSTAFEYFDTGFRDGNTITSTATITYNVSLDYQDCIDTFASDVIDVTISLRYKDGVNTELDLFYDYLTTVKINSESISSKSFGTQSVTVNKSIDLNDYTSNIILEIEYSFNTESVNFYEEIFPYLYNDNISFCMDLAITEGGN